ncbi:MAG TPA: hypothetical protein VHJ82_09920, partial [Actinomycetota bacterium]|nr:hypothetical protein [Actinomycetota bacterium]
MSLRVRRTALLRALLVGVVALGMLPFAQGSAPAGPLDGFSSKNVEFVATIPEIRPSGGVLEDDHFYVTASLRLAIYDVSRPEAPQLTGSIETGIDPSRISDV